MKLIAILFAVGSTLIAGYGLLTLTQATQGAGMIALACFVGILARLAQASGENAEIREDLKKIMDALKK